MFIAAAYITPLALQAANCAPKDTLGSIIEVSIIFSGLFMGIGTALLLISKIAKRFINPATYETWVKQYEVAKPNMPIHYRWLSRYIIKIMKPNSYVSTTSKNSTGAQ